MVAWVSGVVSSVALGRAHGERSSANTCGGHCVAVLPWSSSVSVWLRGCCGKARS